ncbi:hypothetical protein SPRG_10053 [Saprolegnia parasitica CBS 223.65]|uniref:Uncharacterized protein n=1 Tax=Saprolegnia parasitica (strain CBS 223.65) TaxID=695850 RepID=A0A067C050_SAPPC|nr:hypothetical protein SPRG_10053 [Saprolegnia parasitica CBS 223.65]KDO23908.1 hypothetical protein SPRG_10053 [Saprolegnia parasitica CBS 223.65]|eukprot:XP_012205376.1 hypothetical protein SPRG_10053 [Saprolegnia parasitica CBS 223.65]
MVSALGYSEAPPTTMSMSLEVSVVAAEDRTSLPSVQDTPVPTLNEAPTPMETAPSITMTTSDAEPTTPLEQTSTLDGSLAMEPSTTEITNATLGDCEPSGAASSSADTRLDEQQEPNTVDASFSPAEMSVREEAPSTVNAEPLLNADHATAYTWTREKIPRSTNQHMSLSFPTTLVLRRVRSHWTRQLTKVATQYSMAPP